jgi:hypothetical protein
VIYVGTDEKARRFSGIFGGSLIKGLVDERQADLTRLIDHVASGKTDIAYMDISTSQ